MSNYSPSTWPANANPALAIFLEPTAAVEMWLPVMRAAAEWNANIFEILTGSRREWLDFANRRLAAYTALPQDIATCQSYQSVCIVYADFLQMAVADFHEFFAELARPDRGVSATTTKTQYANRAAGPDQPSRLHGDEDNDHG